MTKKVRQGTIDLNEHRTARQRRLPVRTVQPTIVDLFAGAGGLSEGFRQAGFSVLAGSDNDPDAMATYSLNFPEAYTIIGDIRAPAVKAQVLALAARATVLVGGPPCQAFSQVRNHSRMIDDPRNSLYREFVDVLRQSQPEAFVMENVTGMDQMGVREQVCTDLSLGGMYNVHAQILDAADFGVPQTRKRLLFIGLLASRNVNPPILIGTRATDVIALRRQMDNDQRPSYDLSIKAGAGDVLAELLSQPEDTSVVSALDAISDLACLRVGNRDDALPYECLDRPASQYQVLMREGAGEVVKNVQVPRINQDTVLRLGGIPQGGNHRDLKEELMERYLTGQRWGQDNGTGRLSRRHFYAYRRLHPAIWAWTLNTKADSVYHYDYPRALSVREFARLQSFPDRFVFTCDPRKGVLEGRHSGGPAHSRYRQVGNAVPPLLARALASSLSSVLSKDTAANQSDEIFWIGLDGQ